MQFEILPRTGSPFSWGDLFQRSAAVTVTNLFFVPKENFPCCNLCLLPSVLLQRVGEGGRREEGWNSVQSQPSAGTGCKEEEKHSQSLDRLWLGNLLSCEVGDCHWEQWWGGDVALVVSWVFILSLVYVLGNRAPID